MDNLPIVTDLRADMVPHRRWAVSRWFYANPIWYYHRPSTGHEIDTRGRFYQLVDPELRELCRLVNDAGILTTPSCQGHSYPRERFERIWDELKREEEPIRTDGLEVKDSENQQPFLFRNPDYRLPWRSFREFYDQAAAHQNVGYLGLLIPHERASFICLLETEKYQSVSAAIARDNELSDRLHNVVFNISVDAVDPQARTIEWVNLTEYVRGLLQREGAAAECSSAAVPAS
jgi:hypothetical protein